MNRTRIRVASLIGLGFGLGMTAADFAVHWMGWTGPTTVSMLGAAVSWMGIFGLMSGQTLGPWAHKY